MNFRGCGTLSRNNKVRDQRNRFFGFKNQSVTPIRMLGEDEGSVTAVSNICRSVLQHGSRFCLSWTKKTKKKKHNEKLSVSI